METTLPTNFRKNIENLITDFDLEEIIIYDIVKDELYMSGNLNFSKDQIKRLIRGFQKELLNNFIDENTYLSCMETETLQICFYYDKELVDKSIIFITRNHDVSINAIIYTIKENLK